MIPRVTVVATARQGIKVVYLLAEKSGSEALCYAIECVVGRGGIFIIS